MQSIHSQLEDKILSLKKGTIVFVSDFAEFGTAENVKKVLLRLEKKQLLVRLAHGIYLYPKIDKELGILYPSTESIAEAIPPNLLRVSNSQYLTRESKWIEIQRPYRHHA